MLSVKMDGAVKVTQVALSIEEIGNGRCFDQPPYGSPACGFDGGDCVVK